MTNEEYRIALSQWEIDIAAWQKEQKAYLESIKSLKKTIPKPGPSPRPPVPPTIDRSKLKDLLGGGNTPVKPVIPSPSGMPRQI